MMLRTSVPLHFYMLALPSWAGMSISLFFRMGVWGFAPLCWPFLHADSKLTFYLIFMAFVPKDKMGFNFKFFDFLRFSPQFVCYPNFSGFLAMGVGRGFKLSIQISI